MAAALYNDMARLRGICSMGENAPQLAGSATSAGLFAAEGDPISPHAATALQRAGVAATPQNNYPAHRARSVTRELVEEADLVVGLSASHAMQLMLRFPEAAQKITTLPMDIPDPYGGSQELYDACLTQLKLCLQLAFAQNEGDV
jgi:protein-tyrosine phosphatase